MPPFTGCAEESDFRDQVVAATLIVTLVVWESVAVWFKVSSVSIEAVLLFARSAEFTVDGGDIPRYSIISRLRFL